MRIIPLRVVWLPAIIMLAVCIYEAWRLPKKHPARLTEIV